MIRNTVWSILLASAATVAWGQDTVHVKTADGGTRGVPGRVIEYTGAGGLVLETTPGRAMTTIPADRVDHIEMPRRERHRAADTAYEQNDFAAALTLYQQARAEEQDAARRWVWLLLTARIVECHRAIGQIDMACAEFSVLAKVDPQTPYMSSIPLAWTSDLTPVTLLRNAEAWVTQTENPALTLLGASYLLATEKRSAAITRLRPLSTMGDETIRQLATAQLWRTEIVTADIHALATWQRTIERMPEAMQGGPSFVLAQGWYRQKQYDRAALRWMRIPILHRANRPLAANALLEAGRALEQLNQTQEAAGLYREVVNDFADTGSAAEAKQRLADMTRS